MATPKSLTWNDRIAIIERFLPTDTEIINAMGVTQDELDTARQLRNSGVVVPTPDLDLDSYSMIFGGIPSVVKPTTKKPAVSTTAVNPAQTANKSIKVPQKRGRKGEKILLAFTAIPKTPIAADQFATDHGVSLAVLRQSKRFDGAPELGAVKVKKNKTSKVLEIWREEPDT